MAAGRVVEYAYYVRGGLESAPVTLICEQTTNVHVDLFILPIHTEVRYYTECLEIYNIVNLYYIAPNTVTSPATAKIK